MAQFGDTLPFRCDVYDAPAEDGGVLTNASAVTLTITLPDGTISTPTVTNPPTETGKYTYNFTTSALSPSGRYVGRWSFVNPTTAFEQSFDVGSSLVTVDEAVSHLRASGVITTEADFEQLDWLCKVATDAVERDLGRVLTTRSVVETFTGGEPSLRLTHTPVQSVTSVTETGVTLAPTDYLLDTEFGILYRGTTSGLYSFGYGFRNVVVEYVAGYTDPPRIARKVALNTVQGMWQSSQQTPLGMLDESAEAAVSSATGGLNPMEMRAYDTLRAAAVA